MMLAFPNDSRSYDATRRAVRFWGYDSALECSFFVTEDALKCLAPDTRPDETALLNVFDLNRDSIREAATRVYERGTKGSYELGVAELRRAVRVK
jgi:hypothetical protein